MDTRISSLLAEESDLQRRSRQITHRPGIVHIRDTMSRYSARLGNQFAAAITYFLILAVLPMLMFAFAALGFVLDVARPEFIPVVEDWIGRLVPGQDKLVDLLHSYLSNWAGVGILGIVSALYTSQGFIGNVKDAVRAQLTPNMDDIPKESFVRRFLTNTLTLVGILIGAALTVAATVLGTGLATWIIDRAALPGWFYGVVTPAGLLISLAAAWTLFLFIFTLLPARPVPMRTRMIGSALGAVALTVLINLATVLIGAFSSSPTAALFGPVIAIMAVLNVFARIMLVIAAWMGTGIDGPTIVAEVPATAPAIAPTQGTPGRLRRSTEAVAALSLGSGMLALAFTGLYRIRKSSQSHIPGRR
ncbi:YihY/virulence factor BrkB family protein [Brevibacterium sp. 91QC2O2]|uniref:YhjD/YihY/BrkB family envelope integrity protein n=1 Tax=Brevibacterium TaxID=1696 RepID=UPI00211CFDDF|nr:MULTISPECIES: YhjD/YihY/BrkB family envelope integrity protein [unclassified Brevibacterium]MCQ9366948.1 YihY/virulence factor BrkB family protein [Brevibacterium sp. 91QC2O2]MCQ9384098.1 YihY/virulence factor BrkB family protein [Brevibacterium sp. 68QC2CO]